MKQQKKTRRTKRVGAGLLSVFCLLIAVLVLQAGAPKDSGSLHAEAATATAGSSETPDGTLTVTFLDVGQGDAAVLQCDGHAMMIDGGKAEESSYIYAWLRQHQLSTLDVLVATHADADHIGGLPGALNYAKVGTAYCPVTTGTTQTFENFLKYLKAQGKSITVPTAGQQFSLGEANVTILGPIHSAEDSNNSSIVLKVQFGATSFLFTGDAEREEEQDLLNSGADLQSTVLKVGHHGSDTSTSYPFLRAVAPQYAVISVGAGNSYGHPTEEVLSRLRDAGVTTYRTDMQGEITAVSDGQTVRFSEAKNPEAETLADAGAGQNAHASSTTEQSGIVADAGAADSEAAALTKTYVLNTNSHKFHTPDCPTVKKMKEANKKTVTESRTEILAEGYTPCKVCNP